MSDFDSGWRSGLPLRSQADARPQEGSAIDSCYSDTRPEGARRNLLLTSRASTTKKGAPSKPSFGLGGDFDFDVCGS